ncbi:MAG: serine/threonine protein kinase [Betaproteobacteria bacterium]|nr:serine/threonine protein kinase [Betaproteobacteria bacterium]
MSEAALIQLSRYRILAELGRGAMGVVYKAEDPLLNRTVAIKTIIMSADPEERAEYEARFYQEAKAAGGLNHPNVITVHDIGREGEVAYMAMELLEGVELRELMQRGPLPLRRGVELAAQVADGLAYAHECGVVHRDIKPGNIMIVRDRHAKIMDFGIARMRVSDIKTQAGAILGSPRYMSPEQVTGQRADHRSDIFSLGVVVYELAAGEPPFSAPHITQLMHMVATVVPRPPSAVNAAVPAMLDLIVAKALEKDPDARYQHAGELASDLRACLAGLPDQVAEPSAWFDPGAPLDFDFADPVTSATEVAKTGRVGDAPGETAAPAASATKKRPAEALDADIAKSGIYTRARDALLLSRRFDSAEALQRLTELVAGGGGDAAAAPLSSDASSSGLQRLWQDRDRLIMAVAVIAAAIAAAVIALW